MTRSAWVLSLLLATWLAVTGCGEDANSGSAPSAPSGIDLKPDTTGTGTVPGAVASATTLPTIDLRLKSATSLAAFVEYTSTSGVTGRRAQVTGAVFVPNGRPPRGGWPIVVYAHATTGISADCAPSRSPTLLGVSESIATLVGAGYVVAAPDYQGLGLDQNPHPYLDSSTVGFNVIDSVRAVRRLVPDASNRWVVVGQSQGGQAAWAANELAADYGKGLALLGSVSLSAPTEITGYADMAVAGTLSKEQKASLQLILAGLASVDPTLNLDDYRRGVVAAKWSVLSSCDASVVADRLAAIEQISDDDLRPDGPAAAARLRNLLLKMGLPKRPATAPMLVVYGGRDSFLPSAWTDHALDAACGMGDVVDVQFDRNGGHDDVDISRTTGWIDDRFAGRPAPNGCTSFAATRP